VAFANEAGQDLQEASSVFAKPLAAAATTVGDAFHAIMPLIEKDFATLAPVVDRLAAGAAGFIKAFAPGFSSGIQAGAKVFAQFADELPGLGASVGFFFDELAAGAEGGGSALVATLRVTEFAVEGLGAALHSASDAFVLFGGTAELATSKLNDGAVAGITFGSGLIDVAGHLAGPGRQDQAVLEVAGRVLPQDGGRQGGREGRSAGAARAGGGDRGSPQRHQEHDQ
jgi:hypothetical protein